MAAAMAMACAPGLAFAQRTAENALASSDDAFGTQVGLENTGIYSENDARGFSPLKAGNYRFDGIYFDPVGIVTPRLKSSTTRSTRTDMRVLALGPPVVSAWRKQHILGSL